MKLSVVIPAYNEEENISELVSRVKKVNLGQYGIDKEIIVVDDGSKDRTVEIVKKIKDIVLVIKAKNNGKGSAVKEGIKYATGDIIIIQDADLEYDPNEYYRCIKPIIDGRTKVVYGSRFLSQQQKRVNLLFFKKHKSAYRFAFLGGRLLTLIANLLYNAHITDEATCYKTFDAKFIKSIKINGNRFEWEPEILAKVRKRHVKIIEVPVSYSPRTFEQGKKINWKDGIQAIWTLVKYRFVG
jgi:glycosyltransferase involved in cell wall biosynthesis